MVLDTYSALRLPARRLKRRATGCEARLRGLERGIPDSLLPARRLKRRATGCEARLRGLERGIPDS